MRFPVRVKHRRAEAVIYAKSKSYRYYRLAYRAAGKRIIRSFSTYAEARKEAEAKVRELSAGSQSVALSSKARVARYRNDIDGVGYVLKSLGYSGPCGEHSEAE